MMEKAYLLEAYKRMQLIRQFDLTVHDYAKRKYRLMGLMHSAIGAEAYSVATSLNMQEQDYMATTYRNHAHSIAKGIDIKGLAAELCGKDAGVCRGMAGNMHAIDQDINIIAGFGIIGAGLPSLLGTAFAAKYKGETGLTVSYFGDGAIGQGAFHESMNLASIWKLPVLFVNDNNKYAMSTAADYNLVHESTTGYARAYKMECISVDGMDFFAVDETVKKAVKHIREGKGPFFIECRAYRYHGQYEGDPQLYKPQDEVDFYWSKDPIKLFKERVLGEKWLSEQELSRIEADVKAIIEEAFDYAEACALPELKEIYTNVYCDKY